VNRLDGEDKEYGDVDGYKDLFRSLESAIKDYTSGAFEGYDADDVAGEISAVRARNTSIIELAVLEDADRGFRERRFTEWYRSELKALVEPMIGCWASKLGIA
jgi:hypothetical protein